MRLLGIHTRPLHDDLFMRRLYFRCFNNAHQMAIFVLEAAEVGSTLHDGTGFNEHYHNTQANFLMSH